MIASPYNTAVNDSIYAKVSAINVYGESSQSTEGNGAVYTTVPDGQRLLSEDSLQRSSTEIGLTWSNGESDGGESLIDYRISQRPVGGTYVIIATNIILHSYTATGLSLGTTYEFMVEGRNVNGYSVPSSDFSILHAIAPEVPSTPTTTNSGSNVIIDWSAPTSNGSTITSYTLLIL